MILALDCATRTGWCLWDNGRVLESGTEDFSKKRGESNGSMFLRFRHWLHDTIIKNDVTFCIYEQSHHRGGAATEIGVNLTGRVQECCAELKIEYATIHSATLKKFATGSGKASKSQMVERAETLMQNAGRIDKVDSKMDDNEADAIMMAKYASETY